MSALITALGAVAPVASGWAWHSLTLRRRLHAARRDPLSGLPTRAQFEQQAARALARSPHAVLLIDLDGFKALNDTHGHAAGDTAIRATAACLNDVLDGHRGAIAARLGGDEFTAAVPLPDPGTLPWLLAGLHGAITAPFQHAGRTLTVGASIGAFATTGLSDPSLPLALRRADEAMYTAKRAGGGWCIADGPVPAHATVSGRRSGRPGTTAGEGQ